MTLILSQLLLCLIIFTRPRNRSLSLSCSTLYATSVAAEVLCPLTLACRANSSYVEGICHSFALAVGANRSLTSDWDEYTGCFPMSSFSGFGRRDQANVTIFTVCCPSIHTKLPPPYSPGKPILLWPLFTALKNDKLFLRVIALLAPFHIA